MKIMFLDESGDHNLDPEKVDSSYPIFVLTGCIFEQKYYEQKVINSINKLKEDFFGGIDIIFHTAEMIRPIKAKDKRFLKLIDTNFRNKFYSALNKILDETDFLLTACVIKKQDHWEKYGISALDPYLLSFDNLLNRFIFQIRNPDQGTIIAEKRNSILDNQLEIAWLNSKVSGTKFVKGTEIKEKIDNFKILPKAKNEIGLQIADLIASPIGRKILKIKPKPGNEVDFDIIKKKFICKNGEILNCGLTILPKK